MAFKSVQVLLQVRTSCKKTWIQLKKERRNVHKINITYYWQLFILKMKVCHQQIHTHTRTYVHTHTHATTKKLLHISATAAHTTYNIHTSQGSVAAMTFKMGSLRMEWRYSLAVSFMNWSINIVDRVLARNNVDVFTATGREIRNYVQAWLAKSLLNSYYMYM